MADFDFPADLLDLQRAWYAADTRCEEISASHPSGRDVAAGVAEVAEEQRAELAQARAERLDLTEKLQRHPWWLEAGDVFAAKQALRAAARAGDTPTE